MKKLVIAGNTQQATDWMKIDAAKRFAAGDTSVSLSEYIIVSRFDVIRGIRDPHGVFVGTWIERTDLEPIFVHLLNAWDVTAQSHRIINQQWGLWKDYGRR